MNTLPFSLRHHCSGTGSDSSLEGEEHLPGRYLVDAFRYFQQNCPASAIRHISAQHVRDRVEGAALVLGSVENGRRLLIRTIEGVLDAVPDARACWSRTDPPCSATPLAEDGGPALAAMSVFAGDQPLATCDGGWTDFRQPDQPGA